jgi:hypothetical protein
MKLTTFLLAISLAGSTCLAQTTPTATQPAPAPVTTQAHLTAVAFQQRTIYYWYAPINGCEYFAYNPNVPGDAARAKAGCEKATKKQCGPFQGGAVPAC